MIDLLKNAHNGEGVTMILCDANSEFVTHIAYDYDLDDMLQAETISKHMLFNLVQFLGENRYVPTSDNKSFLVKELDSLPNYYLDLIRKFQASLSKTSPQQFSEFTGLDIDMAINLYSHLLSVGMD